MAYDTYMRNSTYAIKPPLPYTPGSEDPPCRCTADFWNSYCSASLQTTPGQTMPEVIPPFMTRSQFFMAQPPDDSVPTGFRTDFAAALSDGMHDSSTYTRYVGKIRSNERLTEEHLQSPPQFD
jgi:hypothetical protein